MYHFRVRALLALLALSIVACRSVPPPDPGRGTCDGPDDSDPIDPLDPKGSKKVTLSFHYNWLMGPMKQRVECVPARLDDHRVRLEPFGNMSKNVCVFPKLVVHSRDRKDILITHCNEVENVGTDLPTGLQVHGQELAHQLVSVFDLPALRTRKVSVTYADPPSRTSVDDRPAYFLEFVDHLMERESLQTLSDPVTSSEQVDSASLARLHLFQILINNRDWRVADLTTVEAPHFGIRNISGNHNVFLARRADGAIVPIPYDFELSGFVGIPIGIRMLSGGRDEEMVDRFASVHLLASASPLQRWTVIRMLHFRRRFGDTQIAEVKRLRKAIARTIARADVPKSTRARANEHVARFYRAIQLAYAVALTDEPMRLEGDDGDALCPDLPAKTAYEVVKKDGDRRFVRLLERLRHGEDDAVPLCPGHDSGWLTKVRPSDTPGAGADAR